MINNSMENGGKPTAVTPTSTLMHYSDHMKAFAASGGVLLGEVRAGNTTHSLLKTNAGMPDFNSPSAIPKFGKVKEPPRKY
jgi:hypothetical protein